MTSLATLADDRATAPEGDLADAGRPSRWGGPS